MVIGKSQGKLTLVSWRALVVLVDLSHWRHQEKELGNAMQLTDTSTSSNLLDGCLECAPVALK